MIFDDRTYTVLVVSSSEKFNSFMAPLLPESQYSRVVYVASATAAKRKLLESNFDFVIINTPLKDDFGTKLAVEAAGNKNTVSLLLVGNELHEEIYSKVVGDGVFTMPKPLSAMMVSQALKWMASACERLNSAKKESQTLETKMAEIRLVNRAKWILIENMHMTEPEAHRYIEKQAMDCCITRREVAESIVAETAGK